MKKRILTIGSILMLALLLAGAAFVGGRLLNGQGLPSTGQDPSSMVKPAEELPPTPADLIGMFDHRQDQSIFVGSSPKDQSSSINREVVITSQTTIYHDVTAEQINGKVAAGQPVQQVLEPGSLDGIGEGSLVTVWGTRSGDRILADVLVYTSPEFINNRLIK